MRRNIQAVHVMLSYATVTIVDEDLRNNHCVKISDVYIKRKVDEWQQRNVTGIYIYASKGYNCNHEVYKGNDFGYSFKEQPLCEDIECENQTEGRCMTKEDCERYITNSKGYTCNDKLYKGNDYVFTYMEQPLCEDIDCEDQKEDR